MLGRRVKWAIFKVQTCGMISIKWQFVVFSSNTGTFLLIVSTNFTLMVTICVRCKSATFFFHRIALNLLIRDLPFLIWCNGINVNQIFPCAIWIHWMHVNANHSPVNVFFFSGHAFPSQIIQQGFRICRGGLLVVFFIQSLDFDSGQNIALTLVLFLKSCYSKGWRYSNNRE